MCKLATGLYINIQWGFSRFVSYHLYVFYQWAYYRRLAVNHLWIFENQVHGNQDIKTGLL